MAMPSADGKPAIPAHDQRTCGECQSMIAHGGHRIIDLLGHAGYPPGSPLKVIGFSVLLALTAAGGAAGAVLFARRDLVQRG